MELLTKKSYSRLPDSLQDLEAEKGFLGELLQDPKYVFGEIANLRVEKGTFTLKAHQNIFLAVKSLFDEGRDIDFFSVKDCLRKQGNLESPEDVSYLKELFCSNISLPNIVNHTLILIVCMEKLGLACCSIQQLVWEVWALYV